MTIADRVKALIADELGIEIADVIDDARLGEQLGADSTDAISLTMALEDEFGIEIPDADAEQLIRVRDVVAYIKQRLGTPYNSG